MPKLKFLVNQHPSNIEDHLCKGVHDENVELDRQAPLSSSRRLERWLLQNVERYYTP